MTSQKSILEFLNLDPITLKEHHEETLNVQNQSIVLRIS